jgi:predicted TIM-barrel fold metal-dependent hydrolase
MKRGYRVLDADVHVIEPMTMWSEYIDPEFLGREPQPEDMAFGMVVDGIAINTWDARERDLDDAARARRKERILGMFREIYPDAFARGFDAASQLAGIDTEGIDIAVLYPSFGLFALATDGLDPALALAISRAYNDWMAGFCSLDPARLKGVAMVPRQDPGGAATEAVRAVQELGMVGVFVRPNVVDGHTLDDPCYNPLYEALQGLGVPLGLHEGGKAGHPQAGADRFTDLEMQHICTHPLEQMCAAVSMIYGGVLDRYPTLEVAFLEAGCGWVPFWLERMDEHHENNVKRGFGGTRTRELRPSEYFQRQCYVSANADETFLAYVVEEIGDDRIVFSGDYPHPDSPFPHAVDEFLALDELNDDCKRKILWDNSVRMYHFDDIAPRDDCAGARSDRDESS